MSHSTQSLGSVVPLTMFNMLSLAGCWLFSLRCKVVPQYSWFPPIPRCDLNNHPLCNLIYQSWTKNIGVNGNFQQVKLFFFPFFWNTLPSQLAPQVILSIWFNQFVSFLSNDLIILEMIWDFMSGMMRGSHLYLKKALNPLGYWYCTICQTYRCHHHHLLGDMSLRRSLSFSNIKELARGRGWGRDSESDWNWWSLDIEVCGSGLIIPVVSFSDLPSIIGFHLALIKCREKRDNESG